MAIIQPESVVEFSVQPMVQQDELSLPPLFWVRAYEHIRGVGITVHETVDEDLLTKNAAEERRDLRL